MNGLVLIDKPKGPTSNQISIWIKDILNTKAAHCGTLDPEVTGVLPVLLGKGIKLLEYLQEHDKEYICLMKTEKEIPGKKTKELFSEFIGKIYQRPPEISAVAKNIRVRQIYNMSLIEQKGECVLFKVYCEHGVYIRKLVEDFGYVLGCKIKMIELRRTEVGHFKEEDCVSLTKLQDAIALQKESPELLEKMIKSLEYAVEKFPKVYVKDTAVKNIQNGADLMAPGFISAIGHIVKAAPVAMFDEKKSLIGIGLALYNKKEITDKKKGPVIKTKKIIR